MRNLFFITTAVVLSGCAGNLTKQSAEEITNARLCVLSTNPIYENTRLIAREELAKRNIDWRGFECDNARSTAKQSFQNSYNQSQNNSMYCTKDVMDNYRCR